MTAITSKTELAINNGPPVRSTPFPRRQLFGLEEKQAAVDLFDQALAEGDNVLGYHGNQETAYCQEFADFMGGGFAEGVNSGTNAFFVALRALELPPFSEVIVPAISDCGGVMPVVFCNCIPVPADCAPGSYNVGPDQIADRLTEHTSAIVIAHITGLPIDMDPVMEIAAKAGVPVIEDCAQAHGAMYKGRLTGTMGDIAFFSTMHGKHHATGDQGGVVFTKSEELYWNVRRHSDRGKPHGIESDNGNVVAGLNCNMTELDAAIGRVGLRKLSGMNTQRQDVARIIARGCHNLRSIRMHEPLSNCDGVYWFLFFEYSGDDLNIDLEEFKAAVIAEGIPVGGDYRHIPMDQTWARERRVFSTSGYPWTSPDYKGNADQVYDVPNIETTVRRTFTIHIHEGWSTADAADVVTALTKVEKAFLA